MGHNPGDNLSRGISSADHPGSLSLAAHTVISATSRPELGDRELVETAPKVPSAPGTSCSLRFAVLTSALSSHFICLVPGQGHAQLVRAPDSTRYSCQRAPFFRISYFHPHSLRAVHSFLSTIALPGQSIGTRRYLIYIAKPRRHLSVVALPFRLHLDFSADHHIRFRLTFSLGPLVPALLSFPLTQRLNQLSTSPSTT